MHIRVTDIYEETGVTMVTAECAIGKMRGVWHFREAPVKGKSYGIEFTFNNNEPIDGSTAEVLKGGSECISTDGKVNIFTAKIEDTDDIFFLRFSHDGLSMLDIKDPPAVNIGDFLRFTVECVKTGIYPYL
ncbi:hypothetical protein [Ruminococcus albus]|uniref:Uncharacterized protein n=1 Tax=Ruminococcus albus (strain ATCC 27210 / DSM 20455 / JCM 14654 / NCDO 2250 / 7) TaxID=697329 RepID=E6UIJ6_RUMA7|nr:hypothetical protein [Ruminococcus albus]ADU23341.1 hypothetical protein Rumal_2875 [Ruminococcus albus 7 = DSM 20455]